MNKNYYSDIYFFFLVEQFRKYCEGEYFKFKNNQKYQIINSFTHLTLTKRFHKL
jgi:hypothetical protein